jgi:DNA repair protein RecO (recombination protein O)
MSYTTDGLVIREIAVGENDKMLTLLTPDRGRISVVAKGARSLRSQVLSVAQLYSYGNYEIHEKGEYKWLRGGSLIEGFFGLREDIDRLSLAAYIADIACELTGEDLPSIEMLRMTLNTFYAISKGQKSHALLKGVYELRAAGFSGFMPELAGCRYCKSDSSDRLYLDVMNGCCVCSDCINKRALKQSAAQLQSVYDDERELRNILLPITPSVLAAMRYVINALPERMFSFNLDGKDEMDMFSRAAEEYLLHHLERGFTSLDFYKSIAIT